MPRILVADDNTNIQKMVASAFEERGIHVISVGNGEAAVRRIPDLKPDLILADIFMPVRNGYEVCEFVKKNDQLSHVPVILMVGAFDPLDEKEARRVGADGVLKKPFVPPDPLIAMVMSALERNPKLAAEIVKAKEEATAPPTKPPAKIPKNGPKPLPEFPEPSPEEAALVYGFGTGRRDLDEDAKEKAEGPKPPVTDGEEEQEAEPFATKDWRRAAMDFEVPEDAAKRPAFSTEDLEPVEFPSERDVPPRHVYLPEFEEPAEAAEKSAAADLASAQEKPEGTRPAGEPAHEGAPEAAPVVSESASEIHEPAPAAESKRETDSGAESAPRLVPRPSHWMDMLSPLPAEPSNGGVSVDATPPSASEPRPAEEPPAVEAHSSAGEDAPPTGRAPEPEPQLESEPRASEPVFSAPVHAEKSAQDATPDLSRIFSPMDYELVLPDTEDTSTGPIGKDPYLVEPPPVDVTPEPLLVSDDDPSASDYVTRAPEETTALHSYFAPGASEPAAQAPQGDESAPASEAAATASPKIPFLQPPATEPSRVEEPAAVDSGVVNAVAQKLLEKLGPQLNEILSKNVLKPLVENLVQEELTKKDK